MKEFVLTKLHAAHKKQDERDKYLAIVKQKDNKVFFFESEIKQLIIEIQKEL